MCVGSTIGVNCVVHSPTMSIYTLWALQCITIRERGKWVQWGEQQTWVPVGKTRRRQRVGDWQEVGRKAS